ncbi:hypothetical protein HL653_03130 [Sphingomonas sp. AP4-R1]|uniref:hypothetical protein n=1 Tax=Sphingomonas sp. AP4-R1 TaxID=2735134 RepID=UPI001493D838|nr:hypothetical protein [Sphingomonas sp. AP4-R1]QJU56920.1 hypothetical protein HL653_03130 [Sphingomonas sp. AP4-R1]
MESFRLRSISFDLPSLGKSLRTYVTDNPDSWDRHWVLVTKKFTTDGFTFVLSGSAMAALELDVPVSGIPVNIADTTLGINLSSEHLLDMRVVAQGGIEPYFVVHKFLPKTANKWALQKYAQKDIYDFFG